MPENPRRRGRSARQLCVLPCGRHMGVLRSWQRWRRPV